MIDILLVMAHADDEVIGAAASIWQWSKQGLSVGVVFVADGESSRAGVTQSDIAQRQYCAQQAADVLGMRAPEFLDYPDNQLDTVPMLNLAKDIGLVIQAYSPRLVITHDHSDLNIDHRRVLEAVLIATRPTPGQCVQSVLALEVPSATGWQFGKPGFDPNIWQPITEEAWQLKNDALAIYHSEIPESPHARSLEALDALCRFRGSQSGFARAEAFRLLRSIGGVPLCI